MPYIELTLNNKNRNSWINIKCIGTTSNSSAIGTKVKVKAIIRNNSVWQLGELSGQTGGNAQNSLNAEFGLGDASIIDSLVIQWPTGIEQVFTNVPVNQFFVVTENTPPTVGHSPQLDPQPVGQDIRVEAIVSDDSEDIIVMLFYRRGGESNFTDFSMTKTNDIYEGIIPANFVTSQGVEYFILVEDDFGLTDKVPSSDIFSIRTRIEAPGVINESPQPNGDNQSAYRLISIPINLANKSPEAVLQDDFGEYNKKKWRYYELKAEQSYIEFPGLSEMEPGKAFWLLVKSQGKIIDTGAGISNRTDEEYAIPLHPEWNFIGNPFNFPVPIANLRLKSRGQPEPLSFSGDWNNPITNPIPRILPFEGYAVFNDSTAMDTLFVNPDISSSAATLAKYTTEFTKDNSPWSIRIVAQCQEARDSGNVLGLSANASEGRDGLDLPEPPVIGEYVSVYFPHPDWQSLAENFCTDFRPESEEGYIWEFEVKTNIRDKVNLTFENIDTVPQEFEVFLVDEAAEISQNLRQNNLFSLAGSEEHPRRLKLVIGKSDFVNRELAETQAIPTSFELSQNFPNPFNPATTIRYGLPKNEKVTIKIYNVLGEEVVTLVNDEEKRAGYHVAIWDGRNYEGQVVASGIYVYQLRAGNFIVTRKMALVR